MYILGRLLLLARIFKFVKIQCECLVIVVFSKHEDILKLSRTALAQAYNHKKNLNFFYLVYMVMLMLYF